MDASVVKAVSVLKLYRDSLRLAKHLGAKVSHRHAGRLSPLDPARSGGEVSHPSHGGDERRGGAREGKNGRLTHRPLHHSAVGQYPCAEGRSEEDVQGEHARDGP